MTSASLAWSHAGYWRQQCLTMYVTNVTGHASMAPQRRSQRQQQKQLAAAPDCAPPADQQDSEPPSKRPRRQSSPGGTATPPQQAPGLSQMEAERAARIAANQVSPADGSAVAVFATCWVAAQ